MHNRKIKGFTLIEVMIVVGIIGILAAVGYPAYTSSVAKSNRAEALQELVRFANLQEQLFVDSRTYTADMGDLDTSLGTDTTYTIPNGTYIISAAGDAATFTLTAQAQSNQITNDPDCKTLTITNTGGKLPLICWE